jgi:hypothetical protein
VTHDFAVSVQVDPGNAIPESDETNNAAGPEKLTIQIPNDKKVVYVQCTDILGGVPAVTVVLKAANGESAETETGSDGWCCFTGVVQGTYTIAVSKEGYKPQTVIGQAGSATVYTKSIVLERNGDIVGLTQNDRDHDLLSDELELFYGTDPDNPDTDGDGVIDGKDLSPLIDPAEPFFSVVQKSGMVRFEQPICAYGLDGWCEVWDMEFSFSTFKDELRYIKT